MHTDRTIGFNTLDEYKEQINKYLEECSILPADRKRIVYAILGTLSLLDGMTQSHINIVLQEVADLESEVCRFRLEEIS